MSFLVLKFGGSSVGSADRIKNVIKIVLASRTRAARIAVVVSALQGVTDKLIDIGNSAAKYPNKNYLDELNSLKKLHLDTATDLVPDKSSPIFSTIDKHIAELTDLLNGANLVREISLRTLDHIMSFGERLCANIIACAINTHDIEAQYLDARSVVVTDNNFGAAKVNFDQTNQKIKTYFESHPALQIITGFIGSTSKGDTVTLGRGGSDYSAAIFGSALDASEVEIWTDVDGVMTADPRKVKKAFSLAHLTYEEAMELSHFGAKVIHPPTMQPAMRKGIPLRIRNTFNPDFLGTIIDAKAHPSNYMIKGISSIPQVSLIRVQGSGMVGVAGISMRLFGALAENRVNVILITQASSEHTICIAVDPKSAETAKMALEEEFALEIKAALLDQIVVDSEFAIISAVGEDMKSSPGVAGRLFQSLGKNGVNVIAIAQGSSELNISVVVEREHEVKALNALHDGFFLSGTKSLNLFVVGHGVVGSELLKIIAKHRSFLKRKKSLELRIIALASSKKMLFDMEGIKDEAEKEIELRGSSGEIVSFVDKMIASDLSNSVFVDCTASDEVVGKYVDILNASISIVTPNKRAHSGSMERYLSLKEIAQKRNIKFLYETSVGAGLPIISTLDDLLSSGDEILKIEAVLSGTLSYIFNNFSKDRSFSSVVREAKDRGYTEPDPREDLKGLDVARKLLILARESGLSIEPGSIQLNSLLTQKLEKAKTVEEFFTELVRSDEEYEEKRKAAEEKGERLRYIATLEGGKARVALQSVDISHPFYNLSGADNIVSFTTERYRERPLVIKGPGAGAEVTAAGVLADIIRVAHYLS